MRDVISGALMATAEALKICQKAKTVSQVKREVERIRDGLLSITADEFEDALPGRK